MPTNRKKVARTNTKMVRVFGLLLSDLDFVFFNRNSPFFSQREANLLNIELELSINHNPINILPKLYRATSHIHATTQSTQVTF